MILKAWFKNNIFTDVYRKQIKFKYFFSSHLPEGIERTFVMIKPDGVQRGLVGSIISRFEQKGLKLVGLKFMHASECLLRQHYAEHEGRPFFEPLVKYVQSGPVVAMVLEGPDAIKVGRLLIGTTDPSKSPPGTIRGDLALQTRKNLIHGSDSSESAQREIELWFGQRELVGWEKDSDKWLLERE